MWYDVCISKRSEIFSQSTAFKPTIDLVSYLVKGVLFMFVLDLLAYLDPGTGSLVVQAIIGGAAGILLFGRRAISGVGRKAKALFGKSKES
jgi:F0F1-type ATP synthase assembly protein I